MLAPDRGGRHPSIRPAGVPLQDDVDWQREDDGDCKLKRAEKGRELRNACGPETGEPSETENRAREIVVLNAAAALIVAGRSSEPESAAALAAEAIDSGAAERLLSRLAERSHQPA